MPVDHFNLIAGLYDRAARYQPSEVLLQALALPCPGILLDAGGGTGRSSQVFRSLGQSVLVADPSLGMLRRARLKGLPTANAPAERLPFPEGAFSRVFMMDALHHVKDQQKTASELWRVLSSTGRLVIVEPDIRLNIVKAIAVMEKLLLMRSHFLEVKEITALFRNPTANSFVFKDGINVFILINKVRIM
jgi:ubiquinone/menaquinone biosynthesis C-methylase UbiE